MKIQLLSVLFVCFCSIAHAQSLSWERAIKAVEEKGFKYYEYALNRGSGHPGTALLGLDAERHRCAIVGRILGFRDEIAQAELLVDPPMTEETDPMELMAHAVTLDAWVASAEYVLGLSAGAQESLWNLECVGNFGIPATAFKNNITATEFTRKGNTLYVYGDIDDGFSERFLDALSRNTGLKEVALGSAGGNVVEAIRAGIMIRLRELDTVLVGPCYSACPIVFAGGVRRVIWSGATPKIGLHQLSRDGLAIPYDDPSYFLVRNYLNEMGVQSEMVITWMLAAKPSEIFEPPLDQLCLPRLATWVHRLCGF